MEAIAGALGLPPFLISRSCLKVSAGGAPLSARRGGKLPSVVHPHPRRFPPLKFLAPIVVY